jgi:aspartate racemase
MLTGLSERMSTLSTIGVLGGMGPDATNHMAALITAHTPAHKDQDHIPVITFNNPHIPSRVDAILKGRTSPVPELIRTARVLESAGANFLIMPCNTAHFYVDEISAGINIPILHMVALTVSQIFARSYVTVGLLATTATLTTGLYHRRFVENGVSVLAPSDEEQEVVMDSIFGRHGIKSGGKQLPFDQLKAVGNSLKRRGAQIILAGCTEVSVAFHGKHDALGFELIDPMAVIAQTAVNLALNGYGTSPGSASVSQRTSVPTVFRSAHVRPIRHRQLTSQDSD